MAARRDLDQHQRLDASCDDRNESEYLSTDRLRIAAPDFSSFEGVSNLGQRHVRLGGRLLEVWVQARPTTAATIAEANRERAGVQVCG